MLYEKALQYAEDVVAGKEITTKEVKVQCEWFLDDLERQNDEAFPFYFDLQAIKKVEGIMNLMYFATGLGTQGKTLLEGLHPFQAFFFANIFGWRFKEDSKRFRYRDVIMFIPRKNAKTFKSAVVIIILLLTEDKYSEFYSICVDRELATEVKKAIGQIIEASPALTNHFIVPKTQTGKVVCKITGSWYQSRTSEASRNNAIRPSAFIADEFGAFKDYANINALKSGQLSVRNPLRFKLSTAYAIDSSIAFEELDYIRKVYAGVVKDERIFALLYYADEENLWTEQGLLMSNPLRIEANYQEIRDTRALAIEKPLERVEYLCKHMNHFLPSNFGEEFINIEDLQKCKIKTFDWTGRNVYVGLDLALSNDNCSVSICCEEDLKIYVDSFVFFPKERIAEKSRMEKVDYAEFVRQGKAFPCGDLVVDYNFIEDFILEIESKYKCTIIGIGYDPWNCRATAGHLEKAGLTTVEIKQHSSVLHPATKLVKEKILAKEFFYTENQLLEINFANAKVVEDQNKNMYISKKKSVQKVDMCASLINAVHLLQVDVIFNIDGDWAIQIL